MKKRLLILMTVTGMIILLGGLLTYGLGVHEIIPVPRPDLIVVGTSLIGILLIVSGVCDLFVKKTKEMEIEENDERNISLSNAAMASGFKVMNVTIAVSIFALIFTGYMTVSGQLQHIQLFYVSACLRPVPWQNQSSMHIRRKQEYGICSSAERFFKNKDKISTEFN